MNRLPVRERPPQSPKRKESALKNIIDKDLWFSQNRITDSIIKHQKDGVK
jgi:hypothetical protein